MADWVGQLDSAAASLGALLHKYRILAAQGVGLHLFLEGEHDRLFYPSVVRRRISGDVHVYELKGHSGVIEAFNHIEEMSIGYKLTFYFIDSDLSKYIPDKELGLSEVFYTSHYSVESYLYGREVVEISTTELDNLDPGSAVIEAAWQHLQLQFSGFVLSMRGLTALILAARQAGQKPNLNNLNPQSMGWIEKGGYFSPGPQFLSKAANRLGIDAVSIDRSTMRKWYRALAKDDPIDWVRGKYLLWLIRSVLSGYLKEAAKGLGKNAKGKTFKCRIASLSDTDFSATTFPRIAIPKDVDDYVLAKVAGGTAS